jgi:DNA ligase-1
VYSREGLPLPSKQVQRLFSQYDGMDGELIVGDPGTVNVYNRTQSAVMSRDKLADVKLYIIDRIGMLKPFNERYKSINDEFPDPNHPNVRVIQQIQVDNLEQLFLVEEQYVLAGYEGMMLRKPTAYYKYGRSTFDQHILMKFKRFTDVEVPVMGFVEQMTNTNEATLSPLGYTERSSAKAGMVPAGTLGKFIVDFEGKLLEISCGAFTHAERQFIWDHKELFRYKILVMRYFGVGQEDYLPRFGRAVGWRKKGT